MLRKIRIILATVFFAFITLLFLDFTGTVHAWFGWMAKIQFLPAAMALNAGVVIFLILLTLVFGRIYCSVICPLGVFQDIVSWAGGKYKKYRFSYYPAINWLRYGAFALFIAAMIAGIGSFVALLAPYSSYGRIAQNLFAPLWQLGNNFFAYIAERAGSYAFYSTEVWIRSIPVFLIAIATFIIIAILAWRGGRTYCNTICPVGTVLGFLSRFSLFKPVIDSEKCIGCKICSKSCKASCINISEHKIDYSRCVACMDCISNCHKHAISYKPSWGKRTQGQAGQQQGKNTDRNIGNSGHPENTPIHAYGDKHAFPETTESKNINAAASGHRATAIAGTSPDSVSAQKPAHGKTDGMSRRKFIGVTAMMTAAGILRAEEKKVDGGLAAIEDKKVPERKTRIVPAGARSLMHLQQHCTGCQLCVSVCPNHVLRPSGGIMTLMQPEMSYERGYCRPECTKCSDVCPAGAITPVTAAEKSSIQIGHAVWIADNCVPLTDGAKCGNCARHCPTGAITMVEYAPAETTGHAGENSDNGSGAGNGAGRRLRKRRHGNPMAPVVNAEKCIGCGACENLCPARPFSAIYVEGHRVHRVI